MEFLLIVITIIYIISPVDLWPGLLDDLGALISIIVICARAGINPYEKKKRRRRRRH